MSNKQTAFFAFHESFEAAIRALESPAATEDSVIKSISQVRMHLDNVGFLGAPRLLEFTTHLAVYARLACLRFKSIGRVQSAAEVYHEVAKLHFEAAKSCIFQSPREERRALASPGNYWELRSLLAREEALGAIPSFRLTRGFAARLGPTVSESLQRRIEIDRSAVTERGRIYDALHELVFAWRRPISNVLGDVDIGIKRNLVPSLRVMPPMVDLTVHSSSDIDNVVQYSNRLVGFSGKEGPIGPPFRLRLLNTESSTIGVSGKRILSETEETLSETGSPRLEKELSWLAKLN